MITTLGIAVLNRGDLLLRCVTSVDHPVENLFIINNSEGRNVEVNAACARIERREIPNASIFRNIRIETRKNMGCGPSWNHVFRTKPGPWLITGSDIMFLPGSLALLEGTFEKNQDAGMVMGNGYNVFLMTQKALGSVGFLDENFYPAYYEDCDHWRRVVLSGIKVVGVPDFKRVHGEIGDPKGGSCTIRSDPELARKNGITMGNNLAYYERKWGGPPGKEAFGTPFSRGVPLDFWEIEPALREMNSIF